MDVEERHILLNELPDTEINRNESARYIKKALYDQLPKTDRHNLDRELKWSYILDKQSEVNNKRFKSKRKRKTLLTRKERAQHNLLKLSKDCSWNYDDLNVMRDMWKDYMRENLELIKVSDLTEADSQNLNTVVSKSELIGADVEVVRSTCPSLIGMKGTIVLETKNTFQIVTVHSKLKVVVKEKSVFEIRLDNFKLTVFGKHLVTRPAERSVKKIKSLMIPDL